jgi:hypothetical protein
MTKPIDEALNEASELITEAIKVLMQARAPTHVTDSLLDALRTISDVDVVEVDQKTQTG